MKKIKIGADLSTKSSCFSFIDSDKNLLEYKWFHTKFDVEKQYSLGDKLSAINEHFSKIKDIIEKYKYDYEIEELIIECNSFGGYTSTLQLALTNGIAIGIIKQIVPNIKVICVTARDWQLKLGCDETMISTDTLRGDGKKVICDYVEKRYNISLPKLDRSTFEYTNGFKEVTYIEDGRKKISFERVLEKDFRVDDIADSIAICLARWENWVEDRGVIKQLKRTQKNNKERYYAAIKNSELKLKEWEAKYKLDNKKQSKLKVIHFADKILSFINKLNEEKLKVLENHKKIQTHIEAIKKELLNE